MSKASATTIAIVGVLAVHLYHQRRRQHEVDDLTEKRLSERRGRIRAEQRLRTLLKLDEQKDLIMINGNETLQDSVDKSTSSFSLNKRNSTYSMQLKCIGTIVSPFTKRIGTPRQGSLVPHGRGLVDLSSKMAPMETLQGIEQYSHAWIIFQFHANTDNQVSGKTKVRPPRANGEKIGQMATRSPHRPNPIGLSLVKIEGIDYRKKCLNISGLDLVNGTPVYDIKPVVPWDIPGYFDNKGLAVPVWVSEDDAMSCVEFSGDSEFMLEKSILDGKLEPLYTIENDGFLAAVEAIKEVLAQDPRARKKRGMSDESCYKIAFCSIQVEFIVMCDRIQVIRITDFDLNDAEYVDGIPLFTKMTAEC